MIFTTGNILTLAICLLLVILFRQLDRNNRSLEKVRKFTDKLKDELDAFVKERTTRLEESTISLNVEQTKAVAAVKRLESIKEDLARRETELMERSVSVDDFGKKVAAYDITVKKLLEMTALAESNLTKITSESDFADSLGKKLVASQKQLADITASIPALRREFDESNAHALSSVRGEIVADITRAVGDLESRVSAASKESAALLDETAAKLKDLFQKSHAEAARRADTLEDAAFAKLKDQANERLGKYRDAIEEKTALFHDQAKEKLVETQQLIKSFKADWQAEAGDFLETTRGEMRSLQQTSEETAAQITALMDEAGTQAEKRALGINAAIETRVKEIGTQTEGRILAIAKSVDEADALAEKRSLDIRAAIETRVKEIGAQAETRALAISKSVETATATAESRLDAFGKDLDFRLNEFARLIADTTRLDAQLRIAMQDTEKRVNAEFETYTIGQEAKLDAFSAKVASGADAISDRMRALESSLNELKSRAYENVSEKLKVFEDDFFADLAKRSDAITSSLDRWKSNVDERLETLSAESEGARKSVEDAHSAALKERLAEIAEQYRAQTSRLEDQLSVVESELRARITASDQSLLAFAEQVRAEFVLAREKAALDAKNELDAHSIALQETLRKQERELESRMKEFALSVDNAKTEAENVLESVRGGFTSWQAKNDQSLAEAKSLLADRVESLGAAADSSIAELEGAYQKNFRDFVAKTTEERKQYKESLDALKREIAGANAEFAAAYEKMGADSAKRVQDETERTEQTVRSLKAIAQDLRENVEQTREKLVQKMQSDAAVLSQTLEDIDKRQKAFIAQTKIFDRADDLKVSLENDIETIKGEIGRLDVYRDTMSTLEQQYGKIRKLEEDVSQKVVRFMTEKKRIDIIESDFNKLLALSDSIDRKMAELSISNDDLQQFQVQIRRFEESITDVNGRYERLEKKTGVLDQTVTGIDKAFENLKSLELSVKEFRDGVSSMPGEIDQIRNDLAVLLENKDKTSLMVEKLSTLDTIIDDVEKRTDKMQTAREWLARTETRLEDISRQSEEQLKLLADIMKDDGANKKTKGAPPIGIRENVVKLAHQGWKVDEIARALHLSRGEVELILELPQK
jgi:chromosome segregation ATPase